MSRPADVKMRRCECVQMRRGDNFKQSLSGTTGVQILDLDCCLCFLSMSDGHRRRDWLFMLPKTNYYELLNIIELYPVTIGIFISIHYPCKTNNVSSCWNPEIIQHPCWWREALANGVLALAFISTRCFIYPPERALPTLVVTIKNSKPTDPPLWECRSLVVMSINHCEPQINRPLAINHQQNKTNHCCMINGRCFPRY